MYQTMQFPLLFYALFFITLGILVCTRFQFNFIASNYKSKSNTLKFIFYIKTQPISSSDFVSMPIHNISYNQFRVYVHKYLLEFFFNGGFKNISFN